MFRVVTLFALGLGTFMWAVGPVCGDGGGAPADSASGAPRPLQLRSGAVDTSVRPVLPAIAPGAGGATRYVMQLDAPMTRAHREQFESAGVRLGDYLPDNAYVVRLEGATPQGAGRLPGVRWMDQFHSEWKMAPEVGRRFAGPAPLAAPADEARAALSARQALAQAGKVQVVISLFAGEDPSAAVTQLGCLDGVEVLAANPDGDRALIDAVVPLATLRAVTALDAVQFVEEAPLGTLRNTVTRWVVQSNVSPQTPLWNAGLHGEGQIAGLIDAEVWEASCFFHDTPPVGPTHRKIVAYRGTMGAHSHGTHTAGTFVGDQSPWGVADPVDGMAFAAKLSFSLYWDVDANPSLLYAYLRAAHQDGARVHSNSWGDDWTTAYTTWCEQADRFSRLNEDSLVVFAVTNYPTLKTPENAKNVLAVGATYQAPSQAGKYSGGSGPTTDGRRKPEVFAPGASIVSASSYLTCDGATMGGTSMAAPAVSGMALLARHYYTAGFYPSGAATPADAFTPTGALLKATVINSAVDLTGVAGYPSDAEGWGRLLMDNTLYFAGDARSLFITEVRNADGLSTGQFQTHHVNVTSAAEPLKITLVFTDLPAAVNAQYPVVNDLDLMVTGPLTASSGGSEYLGNYFIGGQSVSGVPRDALNNVEQIHRTTPETGLYTIEVRGTAVNQGTQGYALVASGALATAAPPIGNGDADYDGDIDLADFAAFQRCFTGTDLGPLHAACQPLDLDGDRDVDAADLAAFELALVGP